MKKLGVVIVTYNRINLLQECVDHVLEQTVPFNSIIIVDNNSNDGTSNYLNSLSNNKKIHIISLKENLGGSGGFYKGMEYALSLNLDWLLLIDDDAIIDIDFNEKIPFHEDNSIKSYSGTVIKNGSIDYNHRRILKNINKFKEENVSEELYEKDFFDYNLATFCGLYVSIDLIKIIGLPIKEFFIWYDDTEYSLRLMQYTKIRNINMAKLNHKCGFGQTQVTFSWKDYYGRRNKLFIIKKYYNRKQLYIYMLWMCIAITKHYLIYIFSKDNFAKYKAHLTKDAMLDGIHNRLGKNQEYLPN